jgi:zinc transport system ATP-binding protein
MKTPDQLPETTACVQPIVSLKNVSAGYDAGREVLTDVSLDIYDGDFVVVTGPNGGGKTTLLKVIMGLLPYSSGTVEYADNLIVNGIRRIGYLPQQNIFDRSFPISVIDVVVSGLQGVKGLVQRYTRTDFALAHKLLVMTGIASLERCTVGEISGGQMQRALLCRALIAKPRLLILDEPTTYVDSRFGNELYSLIYQLNKESGIAILIVTHDTAALNGTAKRWIHLDGSV